MLKRVITLPKPIARDNAAAILEFLLLVDFGIVGFIVLTLL